MKKSKQAKISEHEDGVDMISSLPDHILHLILCGLPNTEEVIRTSILSTQWRHLWTLIPSIDIDYSRGVKASKEFRKNEFTEFVYWVLVNKTLDLEGFRLSCGNHYNMSTVSRWIDAAVRRNVKLLDLMFGTGKKEVIELPHCLVTCGSLEVLRLSLCGDPLDLPTFRGLSALRVLELKSCLLGEDNILRDFLKSCPLLEDLSLVNCATFALNTFCISCPELKNLRIDNEKIYDCGDWEGYEGMCSRLQICCPKLVFLELAGYMVDGQFIFESLDSLKKAVIHPEDDEEVCELLSGLSHVESLSLHLCFTKKYTNLGDLPKSFPNLKTLELTITIDVFNMDILVHILICSPNSDFLHLITEEGLLNESSPKEIPDLDFPSGHIFERLKTVKMTGGITGALHEMEFIKFLLETGGICGIHKVTGALHQMEFIKFLLESSPVLETMTINPSMKMTTDEKLNFLIELPRFRRASPKAEIIFVQDQL